MATREENLKKINDQLESMSDEQLDEIAGGFATDPSRPKFFTFIPITEQPITDKPITSPPRQPVVIPSDPIRIPVDPILHEIDPTPKNTDTPRTPGIFGPGIVDPIVNPQPIAKE